MKKKLKAVAEIRLEKELMEFYQAVAKLSGEEIGSVLRVVLALGVMGAKGRVHGKK